MTKTEQVWEKDGIKLDTDKKKHEPCDIKRNREGEKDREWEQVKKIEKRSEETKDERTSNIEHSRLEEKEFDEVILK